MAGIQAGNAGRLNIEIIAEVARLENDMAKIRRLMKDASGDIAKSAKYANDNMANMGSGIAKAGGTSKLAGHHVQNLAFQFQDLGIQMTAAAGSSAPIKGILTALMQQGAQINGIMSQAGIGIKGLIVAAGGMLAPFLPVIAIVGALAAGIGLVTSSINENSKVHVTWADTALGAWDALTAYVKGEAAGAFEFFGVKASDVWDKLVELTKWTSNRIIGLMSLVPRVLLDNWKLIPAAAADVFFSTVNVSVDAVNTMIRSAVGGINGFITEANKILSKADMAIPTITAPQIARHKGAAVALAKGVTKSFKDTLDRDFLGEIGDRISPFAQKRAIDRANKDAKKAGKDAGSHMGKEAGKKAGEDWLAALQASNLAEFYKDFMASQEKDWQDFNQRVGNMVQANMDWQADAIARAKASADAYSASIGDLVGQLGGLGKAGGAIGGLLGLFSGNTSSIGGGLGNLLNSSVTVKDEAGGGVASTIGKELSKVFKKDGPFGKAVEVLKNAGIGMLASSAVLGKQSATSKAGSAIGGALGGSKMVTGLLSKGLESISAGLGQFAGPLGSAIGGVVGGMLGGLFKKAKWGRVDLTSAGVSGAAGNSGSSEKAALAAGNSIMGSLQDLAKQFGGAIGDFGSIAVGVRNDEYRVNTGGTSLKVKKGAVNFGDDAEAAVAFAMKEAIERGAISGIRASTNSLLKAGDDLTAQIDKALSFESVFTQLKESTDPIGAALDEVNKEFAQLQSVFKEAGATAAEYASLEQLLTIKRKQAMDQETDAINDVRVRIAEAQGDAGTVKAIERAKELREAMSDNVRAELQRWYAIEDATEAAQKLAEVQDTATQSAQQLADAWKSLNSDIMDEVRRIRGLTDAGTAGGYARLQGEFNAAVGSARGGDQDAAGRLVDLSASLIEAARDAATSRQEFDRVRMETAASLEGVAMRVPSDVSSGSAPQASQSNSELKVDLAETKQEFAAMRTQMMSALAAIDGNTRRTTEILRSVTDRAGGDAIAVTNGA